MTARPRRAPVLLGTACAVVAWLPAASRAGGSSPDHYVKKATWHETMLASREAKMRAEGPKPEDAPVTLPDFGTEPFTVSAWIKTAKGGTILAKASAGEEWVEQGKAFFVAGGRLFYDIGWVGQVKSGRGVADDKWHHVAVTGKDRKLRLYIDGRLDMEGSLAGDRDAPGHVLKIGYTSAKFPRRSGFDGSLDEVRIYDRELAEDEIASLHKNPRSTGTSRPGKKGSPVAHWKLDGDGKDASGGRNDASEMPVAAYVGGKVGKALSLDGSDHLVVKVSGGGLADAWLWPLLHRDFWDAASRQEMIWEREDGIWKRDWKPGELPDVARRYAEASHRASKLADEAKQIAGDVKDAAGLAKVRELYLRSRRFGPAGASSGRAMRGTGTYYIEPGDVVLLLGDAVTADGGFVELVKGDIGKKHPELVGGAGEAQFVNAGKAGDTAGEGARRVRGLIDSHGPTVAVVCFGVNDLFRDPTRFAISMASIVRTLRRESVAVTILTPPCISSKGRPELEPYAASQAKMIENLKAISRNERSLLADCYTPGRKRIDAGGGEITWGDGIHPNDAGRRTIADALQAAWGLGKPLAGQ